MIDREAKKAYYILMGMKWLRKEAIRSHVKVPSKVCFQIEFVCTILDPQHLVGCYKIYAGLCLLIYSLLTRYGTLKHCLDIHNKHTIYYDP